MIFVSAPVVVEPAMLIMPVLVMRVVAFLPAGHRICRQMLQRGPELVVGFLNHPNALPDSNRRVRSAFLFQGLCDLLVPFEMVHIVINPVCQSYSALLHVIHVRYLYR